MAGPDLLLHGTPGFTLPAFDRLAPPPSPDMVGARIEAQSQPGDVVVDLFGRGGWVARAAIDRQRQACSFESTPLTRLLAEVVLRPPDIRHLDAAFQVIASSPHGTTSLKTALGDMFATHCATCGRTVVINELIWETDATGERPSGEPVRKHYRCTICRDQLGGGDQRHAPVDEADRARTGDVDPRSPAWRAMHDRFPVLDGNGAVVGQLLGLHTPRQLVGLREILLRIEGGLRAAPVEAALRLALLQALLPASRLNSYPGRLAGLRIVGGRVRMPGSGQWRERNPWLAFEDALRLVRGFVQRLEGVSSGLIHARFREDLRSLAETPSAVLVRLGTPAIVRALAAEADRLSGAEPQPRVRLVLGQPPLRPGQDRLSFDYYATAWTLGYDAAAMLPLAPLFRSAAKVRWGWQSSVLKPSLDAVAPLLTRDARVVLTLEEGGPEAVVATVLGAVGAGYRLVAAQLDEASVGQSGVVEFAPPGAPIGSGSRSRGNVALPSVQGGAGEPSYGPGRGLFSPPERLGRGLFSRAEASRSVTDTAVEILKARGEPADSERLLGEILVGLDAAGHLRRLLRSAGLIPPDPDDVPPDTGTPADERGDRPKPVTGALGVGRDGAAEAWNEAMDGLVALIREELSRADNRRVREIEPGRWWLADRGERTAAALPLADRVEWAIFSLLSTAGRLSETTLFERIGAMFTGHNQPDEALIRACLDSYSSLASTPDRLVTSEDIPRRSRERVALIATLADLGHRLGMQIWIGVRDQTRTHDGEKLENRLTDRELRVNLRSISRAPMEELQVIPCIWYVRGKVTFMFELEWTAMLGDPILRRHARIPPDDDLVRFLVIAPERTELVRHKLARSPLLRQSMEAGNWHILKSSHLRALAARDAVTLADLEPLLGLDPAADRGAEQIALFE